MELKVGMTVRLVNLAGSPWDGVLCKVYEIREHSAKLIPIKGGPEPHGTLMRHSWDKHLKIVNMRLENK